MRLLAPVIALFCAPGAMANKADLRPDFDPRTGIVTISNQSTRAVDVSTTVTVTCQRVAPPARDGATGCPHLPKAFRADYVSRRAPGQWTFDVGYLAPKATIAHKLAFWRRLDWTAGEYRFEVNVDVGNKVFETDELNNRRSFSMQVRE